MFGNCRRRRDHGVDAEVLSRAHPGPAVEVEGCGLGGDIVERLHPDRASGGVRDLDRVVDEDPAREGLHRGERRVHVLLVGVVPAHLEARLLVRALEDDAGVAELSAQHQCLPGRRVAEHVCAREDRVVLLSEEAVVAALDVELPGGVLPRARELSRAHRAVAVLIVREGNPRAHVGDARGERHPVVMRLVGAVRARGEGERLGVAGRGEEANLQPPSPR